MRAKTNIGRTAISIAVATAFTSTLSFAQDNNTKANSGKQLPQVEVVGTSPLPGIGIEKNKLPYDVQTVTDEQIYNGQSLNLSEYMSRNLLGVNINEVQGSPFQADITYRGFRLSGILGSSQGLSVYLDGVRVNEPFGDVVNWDMIPEAAISNVTLVPGSNPVYGLNTLGGALAFTTKSGLTAPGTEVKLQAGSFGRKRADVSYGSKSDDGSHRFISATVFDEKGWRDESSGNLGNVFTKIGRMQNDSNWDLSLLVGRSELLGNGLLPSTDYGHEAANAANPSGHLYEANRRWIYTHPDRTKNELNQLTFNLQRLIDSDTELASTSYIRHSTRKAMNGDAEFDGQVEGILNQNTTRQVSYGSALNLTKRLNQHQITSGLSFDSSKMRYGANSAECDDLSSSRGIVFADCLAALDTAKVEGKSYAVGLYTSDTWSVTERTNITASGRFNHAKVNNTMTRFFEYDSAADTFNRIPAQQQPKESWIYNSFNPALGLSHILSPTMSVFGNLGQSNRVPTVIELGCADANNPCQLPTGLQADPYLKQVIARTIELGTRWTLNDKSGLTAAVYRTENKNDILFTQVMSNGSPLGAGYFSNFSKTRRQGIDLSGYTSVGQISLRAGYSYLEATYQDTADIFGGERNIQVTPGTKIAGLPQHTLKLNLDWRAQPKWIIGGTVVSTSSIVSQGNEDGQLPDGERANAKVNGYTLLHLHTSYDAAKGLQYFGRINNALDTRFETYGQIAESVFSASGVPAAIVNDVTVNRFVAPGAPRSFMVGLRYRY